MVDATKTGTLAPQPYLTEWGLQKQVIWDTPGLSDGKNRDALFLSELTLVVDRVQLAAAVILVIRSPARIPHSLVEALQKYMALFGPQLAKVLYIVVNESSRVFPPEVSSADCFRPHWETPFTHGSFCSSFVTHNSCCTH